MNSIGTIILNLDVIWLNRDLEPRFIENVGYTLGYSINLQRFPIATRELIIGTVDDGDGAQGYFTYAQVMALKVYAENGDTVTFEYEGEFVQIRILEQSLTGLKPLVYRPNPEADDWYFGYFKAIEV